MKSYVLSTGATFGLLFAAHIARVIDEGPRLMKEPIFVVVTLGAAGICIWAIVLLKRLGSRYSR